MKFVTYEHEGREDVGIVCDDGIVSVASVTADEGVPPVRDMLDLIARGIDPQALERRIAESPGSAVPLADVTLLPPVPRPSKLLGIVINNSLFAEAAEYIAEHPVFFSLPTSALTGHGSPIIIRPHFGLTHPEAELGVVLGRRLKNASPEEVMEAVFGYTIVNDVTSVGLKSADTVVFSAERGGATFSEDDGSSGFEHGNMQLTYHARSKGCDSFSPCGPWIVSKDEIPDPSTLGIRLFMSDELCTEDNVANLRHGIGPAISHVSQYMTLEPGDIVHMGTAARGKYRLRELDFQRWDGPCTIEIDRVGTLTNPIERLAD